MIVRTRAERSTALGLTLLALPWPFAAALLVSGGWPWDPNQIDLDVYLEAAHRLLTGAPIYPDPAPPLPMIYPPVAAVLAVPLDVLGAEQSYRLWPALNAALVIVMFWRIGLRGWQAPLAAAAVIGLGGPFSQVLLLGQVGIALMVMCILDLAPGPTLIARLGNVMPGLRLPQRLLPAGTLVGLAAAIKLTPALFIVGLLLVGRRWPALVAASSAILFTALGFLARPAESVDYWLGIATGSFPGAPDSAYQITNQSLLAIPVRFSGIGERPLWVTLVGGLLAVVITLGCLRALWRTGEEFLGWLIVGLGTAIAAPISWTHAFTWVAPIAVLLLLRPAPQPIRILAVGLWGWFSIEPFITLNTDTEVGLRLSVSGQVATALGALLTLLLIISCWSWARQLTRSHTDPGDQDQPREDSPQAERAALNPSSAADFNHERSR